MGYLQMDLTNLDEDTHISGVCLRYENFLADLEFTADSSFEQEDEYPTERFHEKMENVLANIGTDSQRLPLIFTVMLDSAMSFTGCSYGYTFIVMNKSCFMQTDHDFAIDEDTLNECLSKDTDCILLYIGMNR